MTRPSNQIGILLQIAVLSLALASSIGCGKAETENHPAEEAHGAHADDHDAQPEGTPEVIVVSADRRAASGIEVASVGPGAIDSGIEFLGEGHPNGDRLAHIVPRFPGIVREVRKNAGDRVTVGDVLAVIESSDSLAPYELKTLLDGVVLEKHLTRGEAVDREMQAFVVTDLRSVWVDLAVYQKDLDQIKMGQRVRIHAVNEGPDAEGEISYLTPGVDQVTRTATARVVLDNPDRKFRPGMFVTARAVDATDAAIAIPRKALQTLEGQPTVFVETKDGFAPRSITVGREGESRVEVLAGLAVGERIAVQNTFLLKAELAKAEAEHEH